jgi:hypothetical protein
MAKEGDLALMRQSSNPYGRCPGAKKCFLNRTIDKLYIREL